MPHSRASGVFFGSCDRPVDAFFVNLLVFAPTKDGKSIHRKFCGKPQLVVISGKSPIGILIAHSGELRIPSRLFEW
jgi:hypothetical protein